MEPKSRILVVVLCLNLITFLTELIIAFRTKSVALKADAFHVLSDMIATSITIYSINVASRQKTSHATYGWLRSEIIGGLTNSVFLLALAFGILLEAIEKIIEIDSIEDDLEEGINLVLYVAIGGLLINIFNMGLVHYNNKKYQFPVVEHDYTVEVDEVKKTKKSVNLRGLWLHMMGDIMGSVVVVISSIVIKTTDKPFRFYLDPVGSLLIVVVITTVTYPLLSKCRRILLHHVPREFDMNKLKSELLMAAGVENIHELHVWQLDDRRMVGTVHFHQSDSVTDVQTIIKELNQVFHQNGVHSATIQPETKTGNKIDNQSENNCQIEPCHEVCAHYQCC